MRCEYSDRVVGESRGFVHDPRSYGGIKNHAGPLLRWSARGTKGATPAEPSSLQSTLVYSRRSTGRACLSCRLAASCAQSASVASRGPHKTWPPSRGPKSSRGSTRQVPNRCTPHTETAASCEENPRGSRD